MLFRSPCILLSSGEATTKILDNNIIKGHGGPSQEMVLSFSIAAEKIPGCALLSIDSEGTDGTTIVAGGIRSEERRVRKECVSTCRSVVSACGLEYG